MTLDPRTIEACANAMKAERERLIAQPLASVWRQLAEAAIRALASKTQSSDGGVEGHPPQVTGEAESTDVRQAAGIEPSPSETPAGACLRSHPRGESDPVVMQDFAPAGTERKLTSEDRRMLHQALINSTELVETLTDLDRLTTSSPAGDRSPMQRFLAAAGWDAGSIRHKQLQDALDGANLAIIDRPTASSPVEVSEDELVSWLHANAFAMVDAVMSPAKKESMIPLARALLSQFIIGRRV